jgi:hypothetical protein
LKIYPNIWAGPNRITLVGSYAEVAEWIAEYTAAGVKHFIIQGRPTMNSIVEFGEGVMPYFDTTAKDRAALRLSRRVLKPLGRFRRPTSRCDTSKG